MDVLSPSAAVCEGVVKALHKSMIVSSTDDMRLIMFAVRTIHMMKHFRAGLLDIRARY